MGVDVESENPEHWWDKWYLHVTGLAIAVAMVIGFTRSGWTGAAPLIVTVAGIVFALLAVDLARRLESRRHRRDPSARVHSRKFWTLLELGTLVFTLVLAVVMWVVTYGEVPLKLWIFAAGVIFIAVQIRFYVVRGGAPTPATNDDEAPRPFVP